VLKILSHKKKGFTEKKYIEQG